MLQSSDHVDLSFIIIHDFLSLSVLLNSYEQGLFVFLLLMGFWTDLTQEQLCY